jgi:sugar lactone lactonase YvrE
MKTTMKQLLAPQETSASETSRRPACQPMPNAVRFKPQVALAVLPLVLISLAGAQEYTFTTPAGRPEAGAGAVDGPGSVARFNCPAGVALDSAGNLYVVESMNCTIRKFSQTGVVTTLAGLAGIAGSADGTGGAAGFNYPQGIAADRAGNLYVADASNHVIRKATPDGVVTTLAGKAREPGWADGTGSAASFNVPAGVAVDGTGNVYVADSGNCTIRKVSQAGVVTTLAGLARTYGSADGTGSDARFAYPAGVAVDSSGNIYVADWGNQTIRKVTQAGVVTTLAGLNRSPGSADGTGSAARFSYPRGVAADSADNLYVPDTYNHTIRKVTLNGVVTTLAGQPGVPGSADGTGGAAGFNMPSGVAADSVGNLYVADNANHTIRKVTPSGVVTTLAGLARMQGSADGTAGAAGFNSPSGVAADSGGNLYVADNANHTIRKVAPGGVVTTLAGTATIPGSADGTSRVAQFNSPQGVAVDGAGNVYVADTGNNTLRMVTPGGVVTTLAGLAGSQGGQDGTGSAARFLGPWGVALDSATNLYVADTGNSTIRKVTPEGVVTTLAGTTNQCGSADGTGSAAQFDGPCAIAVDSAGNVYVADTLNNTIRQVTPGRVVTTLAGLAARDGSADGTGSTARFCGPRGIAVEGDDNVYVADSGNNTIRVGTTNVCPDRPTIDLPGGPVGQTRQLDTSPKTALAWQWSLVRRPANSLAALSAANVRNPTFTPDVADSFVFLLAATNTLGATSARTLAFTATALAPPHIVAPPQQALAGGQFTFTLQSQAGCVLDIQASADLANWTTLTTLTNVTGSLPFVTPVGNDARRFYRLREW